MSKVILVNEYNHIVGIADKQEAHIKGLLHRAFSIFVFRKYKSNLELLLQRRALSKYHCGGLWTNTCSHPQKDENAIFLRDL